MASHSPVGSQNSAPPKTGSRDRPGIREQRQDGEPTVYRELPSFPKFNEKPPADASLEEICLRYPNHLRGSYLDAFLQYYWTAADIYKRLSELAIRELRETGVSTCDSIKNRANFLNKRLDQRMSSLTTEQLTALCTGPKLRKCMMDGSEVYGKCKMQGRFHNPFAAALRKYPGRRTSSVQSPTPVPAPVPAQSKVRDTLVQRFFQPILWESEEQFVAYTIAMAERWRSHRDSAEIILICDALHFDASAEDRQRLIVEMANWPAEANCPALFNSLTAVERSGEFNAITTRRVQNAFTEILESVSVVGEMYRNGNSINRGRMFRALQAAVFKILAEERRKSFILQDMAEVAKNHLENGEMRPFVERTIELTSGGSRDTGSRPNIDNVVANGTDDLSQQSAADFSIAREDGPSNALGKRVAIAEPDNDQGEDTSRQVKRVKLSEAGVAEQTDHSQLLYNSQSFPVSQVAIPESSTDVIPASTIPNGWLPLPNFENAPMANLYPLNEYSSIDLTRPQHQGDFGTGGAMMLGTWDNANTLMDMTTTTTAAPQEFDPIQADLYLEQLMGDLAVETQWNADNNIAEYQAPPPLEHMGAIAAAEAAGGVESFDVSGLSEGTQQANRVDINTFRSPAELEAMISNEFLDETFFVGGDGSVDDSMFTPEG